MGVIRVPLDPLPAADEDEAAEVGAWSQIQKVTATHVTRADGPNGPLVYGDEVPLSVGYRPCHATTSSGGNHSWYRLELRAESGGGVVRAGTYLTLAEHPYSTTWTHHAKFKPPCKKAEEERPNPSTRRFADVGALIRWIENHPFDFWEKGDVLTAGVSYPSLPHEDLKRLRRAKHSYHLALGVCDDFNAFETQLLKCSEVRRLVKETAANRISFQKRGTERVRLYDEVIPDWNNLLWLAIRQALAGPIDNPERWRGRPVTEYVRKIYKEHLNRKNRRVKRRLDADQKRRAIYERSRAGRRRGLASD